MMIIFGLIFIPFLYNHQALHHCCHPFCYCDLLLFFCSPCVSVHRFPWRRRCGHTGHPRCPAAPEEPQHHGTREGERARWHGKDGELMAKLFARHSLSLMLFDKESHNKARQTAVNHHVIIETLVSLSMG